MSNQDSTRRVVAVTPAKSRGGYAYMTAAVYEAKARKDGTLTWRRSPARYARPHRSVRLATEDAERIAADLGIPFRPNTRQHMIVGDES